MIELDRKGLLEVISREMCIRAVSPLPNCTGCAGVSVER